jgi:hypothetical protein
MSTSKTLYARLAPFAPRQGRVRVRHVHRQKLYIGGAIPDWYEVSHALGAELQTLRQSHKDPYSPPLFEVYEAEEKERISMEEHRRALVAYGMMAATVTDPAVKQPETHAAKKPKMRGSELPTEPEASELVVGRDAALAPERGVKSREMTEADHVPTGGAVTSDDVRADR